VNAQCGVIGSYRPQSRALCTPLSRCCMALRRCRDCLLHTHNILRKHFCSPPGQMSHGDNLVRQIGCPPFHSFGAEHAPSQVHALRASQLKPFDVRGKSLLHSIFA
jgi:hypothetical protein